jgi:hypothetical protein
MSITTIGTTTGSELLAIILSLRIEVTRKSTSSLPHADE